MYIASNPVIRAPYIEQPLLSEKTYDSDLNKYFNEKLCEGKLLAKMLINSLSERDLDRAEQEYTQLRGGDKVVRCAATSLLAPCPKQDLYRNIGFIVDVDRSSQKVISDRDIGSRPVDAQGYSLSWDEKEKRYKSIGIRSGYIVNPESVGRFAFDMGEEQGTKWFQTTKELKDYMVEKSKHLDQGRLKYNEVVCEYEATSIIGIIIAFNLERAFLEDRQQIFHDGKEFKKLTEQRFGFSLPLFSFDCETGTLRHLELD
ncbi:hypothetical protein [Sansalvadorimonas verongulae]|uniref:hypothetical protein n=1 Tax=Sansalvadorimonas verongulae TaxID=2172824 RepID=UPI0012BCEDDE|nr:hypothetical protein [Sansalvadorimonas verongulae]MTI12691.1 hypothetical protein [Sansalvadorimonas verongulae]